MHDLAVIVETVFAGMPKPLAPDASRRRRLAVSIADAWHRVGGTHEGIEPFVRYWLKIDRERRQFLLRQRIGRKRAMAAVLRMSPRHDDAA